MTSGPGPLVVLVRHGETAWNRAGRFQGQHDTTLSEQGLAQAATAARALAQAVRGRRVVLVTSDLRRARATALAVAGTTDVAPLVDPRLREVSAGRWQGLLRHEIEALDPAGYRAWRAGEDVSFGGGETPSDAGRRVSEAVVEHAAPLGPDDVLVAVGHGASLRSGVALLLGQPVLRRVLAPLGNTATVVLERGPGWLLRGWNVPAAALPDLLPHRAAQRA